MSHPAIAFSEWPASAYHLGAYYATVPWGDGYLLVDRHVVVVAALVGLIVIVWWLVVACFETGSRAASRNLPAEIEQPQSVDYYEDHTSRVRALKQKLDADTALAESYFEAMRAKGELDDMFGNNQHDTRGR